MRKGITIQVSGKVQGVWYRGSTEYQAKSLGIVGFVENRPDGSVYVEAFGEESALTELVAWCHIGPKHAWVDEVVVQEIPIDPCQTTFLIRRS